MFKITSNAQRSCQDRASAGIEEFVNRSASTVTTTKEFEVFGCARHEEFNNTTTIYSYRD